jgi:hypothetical protein
MFYNTYDSSVYLLDLYEKYIPDALTSGGYNRKDLDQMFSVFGVSGKINLMIKVLNDLEIFDEILSPITISDSAPTQVEMWANGDWGRTSTIVRAEGSEIQKRTLSIPADTYGHQVNISKMDLVRAMAQSQANGGTSKSAFVTIDLAIIEAVKGYKTLLRRLALKALFSNPTTDESPTLPVLYRDTTGFATKNKVVPPRNGLLEFTTGASQEHHVAIATIDTDFISSMRSLIVNKGGNTNSIVVIASEATWKTLVATLTHDELESLKFIQDLGMEKLSPSPITSTYNVVLADSEMPLNYWLAYDSSKKILQKRTNDIPSLAGVNVDFNTIPAIQAMYPNSVTSAITALSDNAIKEACVNGSLKLSISQIGFGVIACGSAVVGFSGGASYIEPDFKI